MYENMAKNGMANITINFPEVYDARIQDLKELGITPSRSEAVRTALREFLQRELNDNLELLLENFEIEKKEKESGGPEGLPSITNKYRVNTPI